MRILLYSVIMVVMIVGRFGDVQAAMRDLPSITVLAASSLTNVMTKILRDYSKESGITVSAVYESSSELAHQIESGNPADIFISAHPQWMTQLKQKGLIDVYSLTNLVENKLVLAVSSNSNLLHRIPRDLSVNDMLAFIISRSLLVIADPEMVPLGNYTKQAIQQIGEQENAPLWVRVASFMIKTASASHSLYLIAKGKSAGVLYQSDAWDNHEVAIIAIFPKESHEPIIYQAAVVAGEHMQYARDLLEYLKSDKVKLLFENYGFVVR